MDEWRKDFRQLAQQLRDDDQPEAVAQLLEHVGDLGQGGGAQMEAVPWQRDLEDLAYDELILASVALTRVRDTAGDMGRREYIVKLDMILATLAGEIGRRKQDRS
jgi:hypothetical protein